MKLRKRIGITIISGIMLIQHFGNVGIADNHDYNVSILPSVKKPFCCGTYILIGMIDYIEVHYGGYGVPFILVDFKQGYAFGIGHKPRSMNDTQLILFVWLNDATAEWLWDPQQAMLGFIIPSWPLFKYHFICFFAYECTIFK